MAKKQYEAQLAAIEALRHPNDPETATEPLRKALANRSGYLVAKAAGVTASLGLGSLIPDLLAALDRFYSADDPQCWAKNALIDALAELAYGDSAVYIRGLRHVQMEPVWGGQADSAGPLRGRCAVALVACRDLSDTQLLGYLIEALTDSEKTVRAEAARAIGRVNRTEAALLLRLRALTGDVEPEVLGACFSGLLGIEGPAGIGFVARFLDAERYGHAAPEAAFSLGLTHTAEAFEILRNKWERERDAVLGAALLTGVALTGLPEAFGFLIRLVAGGSRGASDALEALGSARLTDDDRRRLKAAVESRGAG